MNEIVKGVLNGGVSLIAGWILPTLLNLLLVNLLILPSIGGADVHSFLMMSGTAQAGLLVGVAVVLGLVLNMLQTPLYRILEGYTAWPQWAFERGKKRHRLRKARIVERLALIRQFQEELSAEAGRLVESDIARREVCQRPHFVRLPRRDQRRSAPQRALLREELRRYPVDDDQMLPTRLGNAIRRFEEYGWNRYRLDSQGLWSRLIAVVPTTVRRQVENGQVGVDFFVCLLYWNIAVALMASITLAGGRPHPTALATAIAGPLLLIPFWYRLAVTTTDQWATAVQALVDLGRYPLAKALGFVVPATLSEERTFWEQVSRFASRSYEAERAKLLDGFRVLLESVDE